MKKIFLITGAKGQDGLILSDILIKKDIKYMVLLKKKKYFNSVKKVKYIKIRFIEKKTNLKVVIKN